MHSPDCIVSNSNPKKVEETFRTSCRKKKDCYQDTYYLARKGLTFLDQGSPIVENIVSLLHKYTKEQNLDNALHLQTYIFNFGLEASSLLGNLLVTMLVEVGQLHDAQRIFDSLLFREDCSWNSLITAYVDGGEFSKALFLYESMDCHDSIHLSVNTFMALVKACTQLKDRESGQALHGDIASKGWLKSDAFFGSSLVHMYFKCGLLTKAQGVFDELQVRDTVVWNALITGYAEHGYGEEALSCFDKMQLGGVSPSAVSFAGSLKGCGCTKATRKGQELHSEIVKKGLSERDLGVGSCLVDMYAKCGLFVEAREVLDKLVVRDTVSWSSLMLGYAEYGYGEEALDCYVQMQLEGVAIDAFAFACSLKACGSIGDLKEGWKLHAEITKKGLEKELIIGSSLVDMYAKCGLLERACEIFDKLPARDIGAWTALIAGYAEHGHGEEALRCFEQMQHEGVTPDAVTFAFSLKACGSVKAIDKGMEIHDMLAREGWEGEHLIRNSLIDMYGKCGLVAKAQEAFDKLVVRDIISWNALISGYIEHEHAEETLDCFKRMQLEGYSPDATTFVCSLKACGNIGATDKGQELHAEVARKGLERNLLINGTLVFMYAKCGLLAEAQEVFDKLAVRDTVSWNALMAGYAQVGDSEKVFLTFDKMVENSENPDLISFLIVLHACTHTGLLQRAQMYFEAMSKDYGIIPDLEHHTCIIDLFGRAGQLSKALELIIKMPHHPDVALWHTLLGACQKWGDVEVGRQAFEHSLYLDGDNATAYVCMCNIYANAGMHMEAKIIESMRERARIKTVNR